MPLGAKGTSQDPRAAVGVLPAADWCVPGGVGESKPSPAGYKDLLMFG